MSTISLRIPENEKELIASYAELQNKNISEFIRETILEKIEDEIDLKLYTEAMQEHLENPQDISFDEMLKELALDE